MDIITCIVKKIVIYAQNMLDNGYNQRLAFDVYSNNNDGGDNEDDRYGKQSVFE